MNNNEPWNNIFEGEEMGETEKPFTSMKDIWNREHPPEGRFPQPRFTLTPTVEETVLDENLDRDGMYGRPAVRQKANLGLERHVTGITTGGLGRSGSNSAAPRGN